MTYHNIRLYPLDTEENDEEEIQLNQSIHVRHRLIAVQTIRSCYITGHDSFRCRRFRAKRDH